MADGSVWVSPGMLDTKVIVAPNSPMARANERMVPAMMPGNMSGSVTVRKTQTGWAPSVLAAFSSPRSTASMDSCMAMSSPGARLETVAQSATLKLNLTAVISSGVKVGTGASVQHRETLLLKNSARLRRFELVEETSCVRACRAACQCDGIDDAGVRCFGKYPDRHNARVGDRIRLVNDAERRFASGDQEECGAHVFGMCNATLDLLPNAERVERRLGVFSSRYRVGVSQ